MLIRYLGWSAFQFWRTAGEASIVVDPFLEGDGAHRIPPSPVKREELNDVAAVLVTHGGFDHVRGSFELIKQNPGALLCCGSDVRALALRSGIPDSSIAWAAPGSEIGIDMPKAKIKVLQADHHSRISLGTDQYMSGNALSYIINFGEESCYHGGDSSLNLNLLLSGLLYRPDIAMVGVGGAYINGRKLSETGPREAFFAGLMLGARVLIPMHYQEGEAEELKTIVQTVGNGKMVCHVPQSGEKFEYTHSLIRKII